MTGRQAQQKLQKPIFGDESHIEALKICQRVVLLRKYREQADEIDWDALVGFYETRSIPLPDDLPENELAEELDFWSMARPWEEL